MHKTKERRNDTNDIINTSPLRERNNAVDALPLAIAKTVSVTRSTNALTMTTKIPDTKSKENVDLSFEISIPDGADLQLQVEVVDDHGNVVSRSPLSTFPSQALMSHRMTKPALRTTPSPAKKNEPNKQLTWHESVMDAAKFHKFHRKTINQQSDVGSRTRKEATSTRMTSETIGRHMVTERTQMFERQSSNSSSDSTKGAPSSEFVRDPSRLSVRERLRIFEKNKGPAIVPLAPLAMGPSAKQIATRNQQSTTLSESMFLASEQPATVWKSQSFCCSKQRDPSPPPTPVCQSQSAVIIENVPMPADNLILNEPQENESSRTASIDVDDPDDDRLDETQAKNEHDSSDHSDQLNVSQGVRDALANLKDVSINPPNDGEIYPVLSADEDEKPQENLTSENESDRTSSDVDDTANKRMTADMTEMTSNVQQFAFNLQAKHVNVSESDHNILSSEYTFSEMSDDTFDKRSIDDSTSISHSFNFEQRSSTNRQQPPMATHGIESPILTVESYRRQQKDIAQSFVSYDDTLDFDASTNVNLSQDDECEAEDVGTKIKKFRQIAAIQQQQIVQSINALNACESVFGFPGSAESVEAERTLLVATHRLQAVQNEIERLKLDSPDQPIVNATFGFGPLTIHKIIFPLKQDFIDKLKVDHVTGQHLVCLLKCNEQVVASKTVQTLSGLNSIEFHKILCIENVHTDFAATLEVYGMAAQRDELPHKIKYRIKSAKGLLKTPKSKKAQASRGPMSPPAIVAPASVSNAKRKSSFTLYGFVSITMADVQRNNWTLDVASGISSPLFGRFHMKVNHELSVNNNHSDFLTMFDDVSGFGAWHLRWCRLHITDRRKVMLSYWNNPEDRNGPPIGTLDLSTCQQKQIAPAPKVVCARPNTMLLELKRTRYEDDKKSLVIDIQGNYTIEKHLLSADSAENRDLWITYINQGLLLMRGWNTQ